LLCPNCKSKCNDEWKFCPKCTMPLPQNKLLTWRRKLKTILLFGTAFVVVVAFFTHAIITDLEKNTTKQDKAVQTTKNEETPKQQKTSSVSSGPNNITAFVMAKEIIRRSLKDPSSAKFGNITEAAIEKVDGNINRWRVACYVDAKNSFGATIRTWYAVQLLYQNDGWHSEGIETINK